MTRSLLSSGGAIFIGLFFAALSCRASFSDLPLVINDDGGWCWFEDERAIVVKDKLIIGTVANGSHDPSRRGDIDVVSLDLRTRKIARTTLHKNFEADDHDSPAFLQRPDGRILAMYCKHNPENKIYYRISKKPHDATEWEDEQVFVPSASSRVTYSNLHWLKKENDGKGRVYNFFRGYNNTFKPSWMFSDDHGESWNAGGLVIDFPHQVRQRPYVKYASNGSDIIHFFFTEGHPRNYDNSLYHAFYRKGALHRSDGKVIRELKAGPILPAEATRVFAGNPENVGWSQDMELDFRGYPRVVYSVQKDSAGLPPGQGGSDHRYRFARFDGKEWIDQEIAFAGSKLYPGEDDYTGGICLHPDDPRIVFLSANVDPQTGKKIGTGRYEIYRGTLSKDGKRWEWSPVTKNSAVDNLRPLVPKWKKGKTALAWLRGTFSTYTNYQLETVVQIERGRIWALPPVD